LRGVSKGEYPRTLTARGGGGLDVALSGRQEHSMGSLSLPSVAAQLTTGATRKEMGERNFSEGYPCIVSASLISLSFSSFLSTAKADAEVHT
jgi:hypothetical protein